ncbi:hypothetical protein J7K93_03420 [bacterium]|nr:hypothetical protein [bacterium]
MKKQLSLLVLTLGFIMITGCNFKELNNQWTDKPMKIDGNYSDWEGVNLQYFETQNFVMGSVNDAENIYLMFRFTDQRLARRIQRAGITCWLDTNGKKSKEYGIQYAGSVNLFLESMSEMGTSQIMSSEKNGRMDRLTKRLRSTLPGPGKIIVIKDEEKSEMAENQAQGPSAGSANHNGVFCFEIRMPIPISAKPGDEMSICMEFGGMSSGNFGQLKEQKGGSTTRGGRMGGGRGMGRGRGMRSEQRTPGYENFEKQEIWMKLILTGNAVN